MNLLSIFLILNLLLSHISVLYIAIPEWLDPRKWDDYLREWFSNLKQSVSNKISGFKNWTYEKWDNFKQWLSDTKQSILNAIETIKQSLAGITDAVTKMIETMRLWINELKSLALDIISLIITPFEYLSKGFANVIYAITNGFLTIGEFFVSHADVILVGAGVVMLALGFLFNRWMLFPAIPLILIGLLPHLGLSIEKFANSITNALSSLSTIDPRVIGMIIVGAGIIMLLMVVMKK